MTEKEKREKRLTLVAQWFDKNPNVAHYFTAKIPNVFEKIEYSIMVENSLYSNFMVYVKRFLPGKYVVHIITGELRSWLCANGSY